MKTAFFAVLLSTGSLFALEFRATTFTDRWQDLTASVHASARDEATLRLDLTAVEQSILGFGTAVSELSGSSLAALDPKDRAAVLDELFSAAGGNFTLVRTPIGASDFSHDFYSYDEHPGDFAMEKFSIDPDRKVLLPLIKDILARNDGSFRVWGSPWCPPRWLKRSGAYASKPQTDPTWPKNDCAPEQQVHEGEDGFICDEAHFKAYATYFRKYVDAYRAEGVPLWMVMPQNEFNSDQVFPSCTWKAKSLATFIGKYLGPALEGSGVELCFGTMERPSIDMARTVLDDPDCRRYIRGAGFQWAGKDAIGPVHRRYPGLFLIQTEQECGDGRNDWRHARHSWELMRHYFRQGASAYEYWNLSLEDNALSRWGWRQNSLVSVVPATRRFTYNVEYYVLKQLSHFVKRGARRLRTENGDHLAFVNPDGSVVVAFGNAGGSRKAAVAIRNRTWQVELPADSVSTLVVSADEYEDRGSVRVAPWRGNRAAALSLTFDDCLVDQYEIVYPELERRGLKGTFWMMGARVTFGEKEVGSPMMTWDNAREIAAHGHEVANHGWRHLAYNADDPDTFFADVTRNDAALVRELGRRSKTYCYPGNARPPDAVAFASQGRVGTRLFETGVGRHQDARQVARWLDETIARGDWRVTMTHGIVQGFDAWGERETFAGILDAVVARRDRLWIDTFEAVASYRREREACVWTTSATDRTLVITPRLDGLDAALFTEPLTFIIPHDCIPNRRLASARQAGQTLVLADSPAGWLVDLQPGAGPATLVFD